MVTKVYSCFKSPENAVNGGETCGSCREAIFLVSANMTVYLRF